MSSSLYPCGGPRPSFPLLSALAHALWAKGKKKPCCGRELRRGRGGGQERRHYRRIRVAPREAPGASTMAHAVEGSCCWRRW